MTSLEQSLNINDWTVFFLLQRVDFASTLKPLGTTVKFLMTYVLNREATKGV